ncbi:uncharacterized protein METZ01_LOCUS148568 [marine metagenome]|uniref:ACT domain-containing protein n=1 Tax=marine metagenome TaxID=408172 RepID=A0A382A2Y5_9ZZZZ
MTQGVLLENRFAIGKEREKVAITHYWRIRQFQYDVGTRVLMDEYLIQLEDVPGSMAACCEAIAGAGVNIVSGAGLGSEHAVAALVTDDSDATRAALDGIGANYAVDKLQTIELANEPGSLAAFTRSLADEGVNLRSVYVLSTGEDSVVMGYTTG